MRGIVSTTPRLKPFGSPSARRRNGRTNAGARSASLSAAARSAGLTASSDVIAPLAAIPTRSGRESVALPALVPARPPTSASAPEVSDALGAAAASTK